MEIVEYEIDSCIRGHHVYKDRWTSFVGEILNCAREIDNLHDPYTVCVMKDEIIVRHIPRKISAACLLFLRANGTTLSCKVTADRCYSADLLQGGLEVPCKLVFKGGKLLVAKVKKLVFPTTVCVDDEPPLKRGKS